MKVSVLLSTHRRPQYLSQQLAAIRAQSVPVEEIRIWHDGPDPAPQAPVTVVGSTANLGVWPRFLHCLEFDTEFACIFDDDTIPGSKWLENCLRTMEICEGLIGALGVIFPGGNRETRTYRGWHKPCHQPVEVDIVSHSWFFRRDWLRYYALEPRRWDIKTAGEDYHFSVALQKHVGLPSYAAAHPPDDKAWWGSLKGELGKDDVALYRRRGEEENKRAIHDFYRAQGWRLLCERRSEHI